MQNLDNVEDGIFMAFQRGTKREEKINISLSMTDAILFGNCAWMCSKLFVFFKNFYAALRIKQERTMGLIDGIRYNIKGFLLAVRTPKLLFLGLLRFTVVLILTILSIGLVVYWHAEILNMIWPMPEQGWIIYVWKAVSWLLSLLLGGVAMILAYLCAQLLFCVFIMDMMSRITEEIVLGRPADPIQGSVFSFFIYLIKQEIPRAVIPIFISIVILIVGFLTPVSPVIIIISSVTAAVFLAWDNTDLIPARRMFPFRRRFEFLRRHLLFHVGFGLLFLIPWLNIIFLSFAPVGAAMYYLEKGSMKS